MKLDTNLMLKKRTRIFHLGLDVRDVLVIESILGTTPSLAQFVFGPAQPGDDVDILFVNGEDRAAIGKWLDLRRARTELVGILVSTNDPGPQAGAAWLRRPLVLRDSRSMIEAITAARTGDVAAVASDHLRVLVVDDSFPARQYMKVKLRELAGDNIKLAVDFADSGESAIAALSVAPYDLAFVDVVMPGIDGYEVCQRLKKIRPLRVAMLTGQNAYLDFQRGKTAGCDHYLTKPPHDADLRSVLRLTSLRKITATT